MGRTFRNLNKRDRKKLKDLRRKRQEYRHTYGEGNGNGGNAKDKKDN